MFISANFGDIVSVEMYTIPGNIVGAFNTYLSYLYLDEHILDVNVVLMKMAFNGHNSLVTAFIDFESRVRHMHNMRSACLTLLV